MRNKHHYPENWADTIRPAILKRDAYKCTSCGLRHKSVGYYDHRGTFVECDALMAHWAKTQGFKVQKISLQIAHLDQDKNNNEFTNLSAKCPKCHLNFDRQFNKAKRLMSLRTRAIKKKF